MKRNIQSKQRLVRILSAVSAAADGAISGIDASSFSVVDTGTGVKTITVSPAFPATACYSVFCQPVTADVVCQVSYTSSSVFVINSFDSTDGTTAKDALVHFLVVGSDTADRT